MAHARHLLPLSFACVAAVLLPALAFGAEVPPQMGEGAVSSANTVCAQWWSKCQSDGNCNNPPTCSQTVSGGKVTGKCVRNECSAQTFTDPQGKTQNIQDAGGFLQQALGMLQGLLGQLGGVGAGGGGSGASPSGGSYAPTPYNTGGVAPTAGSIDLSGGFEPADSGASAPTTKDQVKAAFDTGEKQAPQPVPEDKEPSATFLQAVAGGFKNITDKISEVTLGIGDTTPSPIAPQGAKKPAGERSDVRATKEGATIEVGTDEDGTGISGFYGVSSKNAAAAEQSLVSRLCVSRPWANNFLASFIAPSFFDRLCERGGYHVGPLPISIDEPAVDNTQVVNKAKQLAEKTAALQVAKKSKGISCTPEIVRQGAPAEIEWSCGTGNRLARAIGFKAGINDVKTVVRPQQDSIYGIVCSDGFEQSCTVKVIAPRVQIVSDPKSARLGSRATIYWSAKDVEPESCTVIGPSFSEKGQEGRSSTVPITGPTTYTIACIALDGQEIKESVTVDLAL